MNAQIGVREESTEHYKIEEFAYLYTIIILRSVIYN